MASTWVQFAALSFFYEFLSIFRVSTQNVSFEVNFSRICVEFVAHTLVTFQLNSFDESVGMAKILALSAVNLPCYSTSSRDAHIWSKSHCYL